MINNLFLNLNDNQIKAVKSITNHTLVLASPGSGKTAVLTRRIGYLLDNNINPNEIVAFTFTKKAANEMKYRVSKMLNGKTLDTISTFHSFCFFWLKIYYSYNLITIIDEEETKKIVEDIIEKYNLHKEISEAVHLISSVKNGMNIFAPTYFEQKENLILYIEYEKHLKNQNKMDFDDMNIKFLKALKEDISFKEIVSSDIKYILVDECQDLNKIQYDIIKELSLSSNIFMVGDTNQSIYEWRGSDIKILKDFINDYNPDIIYLNQNYRSLSNIINHANKLISCNESRFAKSAIPTKIGGDVIYKNFINEIDEASYIIKEINDIKDKKIFILYRNHNLSLIYEKALKENNINYSIKAKPFYEYSEIKLIYAYYRLLYNSKDDEALLRCLTYPKRGIGDATLTRLKYEAYTTNKSLFEAMDNFDNENVLRFYNEINYLKELFKITNPKDFFIILKDYIKLDDYINDDLDKLTRINILEDIFNIETNDPVNDTYNILSNLLLDKDIKEKNSNITLMSMHQSKGLEADIVFIVDSMEGIIPSLKKETLSYIEQERKLFYVSMTRAKEKLFILSASKRFLKGSNKYYEPSRFIEEADLEIEKET